MDSEKKLLDKITDKLLGLDSRELPTARAVAEWILDKVWESGWFAELASEWAREQGWKEPG